MSKAVPRFDALVAYVPVIHRGYIELFRRSTHADSLYILGSDILGEVDYLRKELRAITPEAAAAAVGALHIFPAVTVLHRTDLPLLNFPGVRILMPDEDVSRVVAGKFLDKAVVSLEPVFLRWHRNNVDQPQTVVPTRISEAAADKALMQQAYDEATHSPDVWRHVGAVLVRGGKALARSSNQPLTTQNTPWAEGDPRAAFHRGVGIEMSTFMHAEARLIADAARDGTSLEGASLYVTTFPCPQCAMLIAQSGISSCYYAEGYAVLDGARVLSDADVELVQVPVSIPGEAGQLVAYPEKQA